MGGCGGGNAAKKSGGSKKTNTFPMPKTSPTGGRRMMGGSATFGQPKIKMSFGKKR